jgi:hypothetical protein
MAETKDPARNKDQQEAADTRPVPSQAEGDEETIDEALRQHEIKDKK